MAGHVVSMDITQGFSGLGQKISPPTSPAPIDPEPIMGVCPSGYYEYHGSDCVEHCIPRGVSVPAYATWPECTRLSSGVLRPSGSAVKAIPGGGEVLLSCKSGQVIDDNGNCVFPQKVPAPAGCGTGYYRDLSGQCTLLPTPIGPDGATQGATSSTGLPWKWVATGTGLLALVLILRR